MSLIKKLTISAIRKATSLFPHGSCTFRIFLVAYKVGVLPLLLCIHMQLISRHKLDRSVCGAWSGRLGVRETENKSRLDRPCISWTRHEAANPC